MVTQREIARRVGLDVSSVNKILNRRHAIIFGKGTVERVFSAAQELGYDFAKLKFYHRRRAERLRLARSGEAAVYYRKDGALHDRGECVVSDISILGAGVRGIALATRTLPTEPFLIGAVWAGA